jgi:hypothetical protein
MEFLYCSIHKNKNVTVTLAATVLDALVLLALDEAAGPAPTRR